MAGFDPDAFLADGGSKTSFDPDAFLGSPKDEKRGGFLRNMIVGAEQIPGNLLRTVETALPGLSTMMDAASIGKSALAGKKPSEVELPSQTMDRDPIANAMGKVTGASPDNTTQKTFTDKAGRLMGGTLPLSVGGGGMMATARNLTVGAGLSLMQAGAEQVAPNSPGIQTVAGVVGALLTHKALNAPGAVKRMMTPATAEEAGTNYVLDVADSSGKTPADIKGFNTAGKPYTGAEAVGRQGITATRALALRPGTTGDLLGPMLDERLEGQGPRILSDFAEATGVDPAAAHGDMRSLVASGRQGAAPLYKKAFSGEGTGAFEGPLTQAIDEHGANVNQAKQAVADAEMQMTMAERKLHDAGDNVYGVNSANQAKAAAQKQLDQANAQLESATQEHEATSGLLKQAQADNAAGVKGGVWSPRLQQLMGDKDIKAGINAGLAIQRREALAAGEKFNPKDYAITGVDAEGNDIVSGVPNMRLLDAGKRGLDQILSKRAEANHGILPKDEDTQSFLKLKDAYVGELDNLNSDYKAARSSASDYLSAQDKFNRAQKMFFNPTTTSKQFQEFLGGLGDTDRKAAVGGVANSLFQMADKGQLRGAQFSKPMLMKKLRGIVNDPEKSVNLLLKMQAEADMAKSGARMHPGVNSTTFESEQAAGNQDLAGAGINAGKALYYGAKGNLVSGAANAWQALQRYKAYARQSALSPEARNEAGRLMMMNPEELGNHLEQYQAAHANALKRSPRIRPLSLLPAFMTPNRSGE